MPRGRPRKIKVEEIEKIAGTGDAEGKNIPATEKRKKSAQDEMNNIQDEMNNIQDEMNNIQDRETQDRKTKDTNTKVAKDTRPTCQCCGKKIDSSVRTLNLTYLTSIAPYRFEVENENGLVKVCGECALELSKVIEMWMIKKGAKKKWSLGE